MPAREKQTELLTTSVEQSFALSGVITVSGFRERIERIVSRFLVPQFF
jgi:hypothetical protein